MAVPAVNVSAESWASLCCLALISFLQRRWVSFEVVAFVFVVGVMNDGNGIIQPVASTSFFAGCVVRTLARTGIDPEFCARQFQHLPALI